MRARLLSRATAAETARLLDKVRRNARLLKLATEAGARIGFVFVQGGGQPRARALPQKVVTEDRSAA